MPRFSGLSWRSRFLLPLILAFAGVIAGLLGLFLGSLRSILAGLPQGESPGVAVDAAVRMGLLALVGLVVLTVVGTAVFKKRILEPADRLLKGFKRVAGGGLPEPLLTAGADELGGLIAGFNELCEALRARSRASADHHRHLESNLNAALADAMTDPLTQVYSRRSFHRRLAEEVARAARYAHPLTLIIIDVDWSTGGRSDDAREHGDRILVEMATLIRSSVRACDLLARCGATEFALILPETDGAGAHFVARRLRRKMVDDRVPADRPTAGPEITVSFGIASFPHDSETAEELFNGARRAVLHAKEIGPNQVRHYE